MELQEFIAGALQQLIGGVKQAQEFAAANGASINSPTIVWTKVEEITKLGILCDRGGMPISLVEFDIALTVAKGEGSKAGIGVFSGVFGAGVQGQSTLGNTSMSRIKFALPVTLPVQGGK